VKTSQHYTESAPLKQPQQPALANVRRDCFQSRRTRTKCQTCGASTLISHLTTRVFGHYCAACCPMCSAKG
jgi:hypothetical protein